MTTNIEYEKIRSQHIRKNNLVLHNVHLFKKYFPLIWEYALKSNLELDADVDLETITI